MVRALDGSVWQAALVVCSPMAVPSLTALPMAEFDPISWLLLRRSPFTSSCVCVCVCVCAIPRPNYVIIPVCTTIQHGRIVYGYGDVGHYAAGRVGRILVQISIMASQVGFACVYIVFIAHTVSDLRDNLADYAHPTTVQPTTHNTSSRSGNNDVNGGRSGIGGSNPRALAFTDAAPPPLSLPSSQTPLSPSPSPPPSLTPSPYVSSPSSSSSSSSPSSSPPSSSPPSSPPPP